MGKEKPGFLTPKAISNRIKSKGLQKLRWYCQMCQKQCRDDNGFKCHLMSESHQRQLLLFSENPGQYMGEFSGEFKKGYLDILRRQFGGKRIHCNVIYQEYIKDKEHVHMNSTKWHTLTGFVQYLGREGICKVDHTEKGWFIEYIDRDPERDKRNKDRQKLDLTLEERQRAQVEKQMQRDRERLQAEGREVAPSRMPTELQDGPVKPLTLKIAADSTSESVASKIKPAIGNALVAAAKAHQDKLESMSSVSSTSTFSTMSRKRSALDELMSEEENIKEKRNRKPYWLHEGIVVKLVSKKLGDNLFKEKAVVECVEDNYTAVVHVLSSGARVRVDQSHVETVIPRPGREVLIVNGAYRGQKAKLLEIKEKQFSCKVELIDGLTAGRVLESVPYEDLCKSHVLENTV